jgi:pimeloyl-ACP methyl ester carboxylesterase
MYTCVFYTRVYISLEGSSVTPARGRREPVSHWLLWSALVACSGALVAGLVYEARSRRQERLRFPPPGRLIEVGGRRLHIFSQGEGPTVVIEQGAGSPSCAWLPLAEELARSARVCLYDRAGYQWSDAAQEQRSLIDRVRDLHELLGKAGLAAPYVLVGHSYGGFLIRLFAEEYPESVAGLVLVDVPHEEGYFHPEVLSLYSKMTWALRAMAMLARVGVPRLLVRLLSKPDPSLPAALSEQLNDAMVRSEYFSAAVDDVASLERAAPSLTKPDAFRALGDLPLAVVTHGKPFPGPFAVLEKSWGPGQAKLAALSTDSVHLVADRANHMVHHDQPEVVIEAILGVVARARSRADRLAATREGSPGVHLGPNAELGEHAPERLAVRVSGGGLDKS